ncbi:hypothetical protein [Paracoccus mutanolyticus]|uniref:hypothetical protein n=1 Tax=Paracoccus mutanolyticus TaxID=1499308 RepID=UPI0011AE5058|nr:hypothetical protein [Paracoccus mutanolyticus]
MVAALLELPLVARTRPMRPPFAAILGVTLGATFRSVRSDPSRAQTPVLGPGFPHLRGGQFGKDHPGDEALDGAGSPVAALPSSAFRWSGSVSKRVPCRNGCVMV